ncbi:MAG TPA: methyltransferase [Gaiellaceae bacterium]
MSDRPPEARLWDLLRGAMGTKALGIAADLHVADALAEGPRPVAELAEEAGVNAGTLHRILRALASDGVFAEAEPGVFRNTEASELLRSNEASSWPQFAHLFGATFYEAAATMDPGTSEQTFERKFGTDFWSWLAANPEERAAFDAAMAGGKEAKADRLAELDWRGDETVVDVGGGNGALLRALLERQPGLRGIILDLPETERDEARLGERITFVAGSFFEKVPAGDVYVLSTILHDWDDKTATAILTTIRSAAPPDARLFVLDAVISPGNEPQGAKWLDLLMLVFGGRERSEPDWRALLEGAGFRVDQIEDGLIQARCH